MQDIKNLYSCRRKKDFVTTAAVALFILIGLFESYLIFFLPIQLGQRNAMKDQVARQRMTALADTLRVYTKFMPRKGILEDGEMGLVLICLDRLAIYIRENQEQLSPEQVYELNRTLLKFSHLLDTWKHKKYRIKHKEFNVQPILKKLQNDLDKN